VFPSFIGLLLQVDYAPRKFKNLGTDAFIASRLAEFLFSFFEMYMQ